MLVKTRKNQGYTSILLNEMSEEAFKEAKNINDLTSGLTVIKPTKKAMDSFVRLHSLTLDKVKKGEKYKILGTTFTVVRNLDYNRTGSNEWYAIVRYFNKANKENEEVGIVSTDNFAIGVHEICFKNHTDVLLYF